MPTIGVLGAGIAGLSAAYSLQKKGASVRILEASNRVGGVIRSDKQNGFLVEHGPNSLRSGTPAVENLIDELDLNDARIWADDVAAVRYIIRDGTPVPLPMSLGSFLSTNLFSARAKFRILLEPFIGRSKDEDESIANFVRRRLGPEILDYAVAPFVGGIFAASPERLSIRHAFPSLWELEREHGSLLLGAVKNAMAGDSDDSNEDDNPPSGLFSFEGGLETLPNALADRLGDRIDTNSQVVALSEVESGLDVTVQSPTGETSTDTFDGLISTVPLHQVDAIDIGTPVDLRPLYEVSYPPLDVLALAYPRESVAHPLDGFGMLVPPKEASFNTLGTLFSSSLFPDRNPADQILLTTFVGGARAPERTTTDTDELEALVQQDLARLLGVEGEPTFRRHAHWADAIPQYNLGYGHVKETLGELEAEHPRLAFAGNYRQGISLGDALESGPEAADRLLTRLPNVEPQE